MEDLYEVRFPYSEEMKRKLGADYWTETFSLLDNVNLRMFMSLGNPSLALSNQVITYDDVDWELVPVTINTKNYPVYNARRIHNG